MKTNELKYYMFDWDDNILILSTKILIDRLIDNVWVKEKVSSSEFRTIRNDLNDYANGEKSDVRYRNSDPDQAFSGFRDFGSDGDKVFLNDTIDAINNDSFGPVWEQFIKCLINGNIFMIITARGHEPNSIKKAVEWIIFNYLTEQQRIEMKSNLLEYNILFGLDTLNDMLTNKYIYDYLDLCEFIGVQSQYFTERFNRVGSSSSPEEGKEIAIGSFVEKINEYGKLINSNVSVGFSDDDIGTVNHIHSFIKDKLSLDIPNINYKLYYTGDGIQELDC